MKNFLNNVLKLIPFMLAIYFVVVILVVPTYTLSRLFTKNLGNGSIFYFLTQFSNRVSTPLTNLTTLSEANKLDEFFSDSFGLFFLIALFGLYMAYKYGGKKNEWENREHGSSDWSDGQEQYKVLSKTDGIILAKKHYLPLTKQGNTNVLVVGGSGAGKSTSYVLPNAKNLLGSYVFTDPKGEIYDQTAEYFRQNGYEIKMLNLVDPIHSDGFNPLLNVTSQLDVDVIASIIFKQENGASGGDPFWDNVGMMLFKSMIYYLLSTATEKEINLANCANLVRMAGDDPKTGLYATLINELSPDNLARTYYESAASGTEKTFKSILITLQSKLGQFDSPEIANLTSTNTIDLARIGRVKTALYVRGSDTHSAYDFLSTIFFAQLINKIYEEADLSGGKLKIPLIFMLDEFANVGRIPDFERTISTSRSRGISFSLILQDLEQLKSLYEKSYTTIMGNCDTHLFLGTNTQDTLEYFSKALGEKTIKWETSSKQKGGKDEKSSESLSEQKGGRVLLTADELRRLDPNECIIYVKGLKPIKAQKVKSYEDPEYSILNKYRANHLEYTVNRGEWNRISAHSSVKKQSPDLDLSTLFDDEMKNLSINDSNEDNTNNENKKDNKTNNSENNNSSNKDRNLIDENPDIVDMDVYKNIEDKFDTLLSIFDD